MLAARKLRRPHSDRAFFRVWTRLPVRVAPLAPEQEAALVHEIMGRIEPPSVALDPALREWLTRIERKLDLVLEQRADQTIELAWTDLELSGSGMRLARDASLEPGAPLRVDLELPGKSFRRICAIARAVHSSEDESGRFSTGLAFQTLRGDDRDAIVRYTVDVQRQQLQGLSDRPEEEDGAEERGGDPDEEGLRSAIESETGEAEA